MKKKKNPGTWNKNESEEHLTYCKAQISKVGICGEWALLIGHKPPRSEPIGLKGGMLSHAVVKQSATQGDDRSEGCVDK